MNKIAKIGEKAPLLKLSDWVKGKPVNLDQLLGQVVLIEVFQVNCPGCFLYSLPQAIDLHQRYSNKGLAVLGLATAFEDFDKNTLESLKLLVSQNKVFGDTLRVLEENKRLIDNRLPYHLTFPIAMDLITKKGGGFSQDEITAFINQNVADYSQQNEQQQRQTQQQVITYLQSRLYTAETFALYALQGTPSHIIIDREGILKACEFGHFSDLEWLITSLL